MTVERRKLKTAVPDQAMQGDTGAQQLIRVNNPVERSVERNDIFTSVWQFEERKKEPPFIKAKAKKNRLGTDFFAAGTNNWEKKTFGQVRAKKKFRPEESSKIFL